MIKLIGLLVFGLSHHYTFSDAFSALNPEKVYPVETKKTDVYIHEGLFVGGDRAIIDVVIKDIRRATNSEYERLVLDLEKNEEGEKKGLERPPYFHVAVAPLKKQLIFTVWGKPKLSFNSKKVIQAFKKSKWVDHLELYPYLEENRWTFVVGLKSGQERVEVFELSNPMRIIVDIRPSKRSKP